MSEFNDELRELERELESKNEEQKENLAKLKPLKEKKNQYVVFERWCSSFPHNRVCYCIQATPWTDTTLIYITRNSLEQQRSNAHSKSTKTSLALRARTQVQQAQAFGETVGEQDRGFGG